MTTKQKRARLTSPVAPLVGFTVLKEPDTKFDPNGTFKCRIALDPDNNPEHQEYLEKLASLYDQHQTRTKKETGKKKLKITPDCCPYAPEEDEEGEETGRVIVRYRLTAHVETKTGKTFDQRPLIFERGSKKPLVEDDIPNIGSGSEVQVSSDVNTWNTNIGCGMTLWINAVMLHKLVEFGGNADADDFGFDVGECEPDEFADTSDDDSSDY